MENPGWYFLFAFYKPNCISCNGLLCLIVFSLWRYRVYSIPIHLAAVVVRILNKIGRANTCIRSDVIFLDLKPLVYHGFMWFLSVYFCETRVMKRATTYSNRYYHYIRYNITDNSMSYSKRVLNGDLPKPWDLFCKYLILSHYSTILQRGRYQTMCLKI